MSKTTHKIAHLTSVHPRYDTRIYLKECASLVKEGYEVHLVVADGKCNESINQINIHDVGNERGRFKRILNSTRKIYQKAIDINCKLYHIHDPELIPIGLMLKRKGYKVIFDAHEDVPKQLLSKPYLNRFTSSMLSKVFLLFEKMVMKHFDCVVAATPSIANKQLAYNEKVIEINNFPLPGELSDDKPDWALKKNKVCYIGGMSRIRGIQEIVDAMAHCTATTQLSLAGKTNDKTLIGDIKSSKGWNNVEELGFIDRNQARELLCESMAGIVTFLPLPNHIDAQPNKMFEYMSAGIPIIASNFPLWNEIVEGNDCGICVDPENPSEIAKAIDFIIANPDIAKQKGENGSRAVNNKYNWDIEENKLYTAYRLLLS
ncbi:glycosyltransferase family 4 protein [Enterovibrio norvegicus]|uniref:glycosyltransferase family 4 protein n=1 Tax=Enterovibrio norvegicus TaxID=188144 RepID=UPI0038998339